MNTFVNLFEFASRQVCGKSFCYGVFVGLMAMAGYECVTQMSGAWFIAMIVFGLAGKVCHGVLPALK